MGREGDRSALIVHASGDVFYLAALTLTLSRPAGRGDSDWMIALICKRVVRYTPSGGSQFGAVQDMPPMSSA